MSIVVLIQDGLQKVGVAPDTATVRRRAGPFSLKAKRVFQIWIGPCLRTPKSYTYRKRNRLPLFGRMSLILMVVGEGRRSIGLVGGLQPKLGKVAFSFH